MASGTQAPWVSLVRFAAKMASSNVRNSAAPHATSHSGRCHPRRTMTKNRTVVITIVPVTAMP